jgi:predicted enzyme related to lactoylglutathione lyase
MWIYYTDVADLDAAMARATKHGAKVMNGPMEVPGGARIVQMMDPQGAAFALHESKKQ